MFRCLFTPRFSIDAYLASSTSDKARLNGSEILPSRTLTLRISRHIASVAAHCQLHRLLLASLTNTLPKSTLDRAQLASLPGNEMA
jgi:hypothetical protein